MAASESGTRLTEQERAAQLALRAAAVRDLAELWPLLDPTRIDSTAVTYLRLATSLVRDYRARSARGAQTYYQAFRAAETGDARPVRVLPRLEPDPGALTTSLTVTGPVGLKQRSARGVATERAAALSLVDASGAVARHVLDGGRDTIASAVRDDAGAVGFIRVTDASPCPFCAMLATRAFDVNGNLQGVYATRDSAQFRENSRPKLPNRGGGRRLKGQKYAAPVTYSRNKYHDHCGCSVEPVFPDGADNLPQRSLDFNQLWIDSTYGLSGKDAMRAFSKALADHQGRSA